MATLTTTIDGRRADRRVSVQYQPVWFTSIDITTDHDDKSVIVLDFPATGRADAYMIHAVYFQVVTAFTDSAGTPSVTVGKGSIASYATWTDGDTLTYTALDGYIPSADITEATPAYYGPDGGTFVTAVAAGDFADAYVIIESNDTTCPVIFVDLDNADATGRGRLHILMSKLP